MKQPTFRKQWLAVWLLALAVVGWVAAGESWTRRHLINPPPIPQASRVEDRFIALLFPRVTPGARKFAMSRSELADLLGALKKKGYVSISLDDVAAFYAGKRLLPPKAVLLAFSGDDSRGIMLADRALKKLRLRGNVFLTRTTSQDGADRRMFLTRHAIAEMKAGGAWEFGWISQANPETVPELGPLKALLDDDGARPRPSVGSYPLRFAASELALNDGSDDPHDLRIMTVRADRLRELNERLIENSWTRKTEVADDFSTKDFDPDWIPGWGVVSKGDGRLTLLPLPRQTGAGIFLRGTDKWRDVVLEFDLNRHQKEFWAYARYRGEAGYVRVGVRGGFWYVEQKIGPKNLPTMLARAPFIEDGRPARVRFVLKDDSAIVHVNGRMLFGRSLRVHPRVARGRVLFGVYDVKPRTALAVLSHVRAGPVKETWVAFKDGGAQVGFDEARLDALREEAVYARAITPRWLTVGKDGSVVIAREQETLIRSLAGFYGCRLVPMAELPSGLAVLSDPAASSRLLGGLQAAARELDAAGVNLRVRADALARPETRRFLGRLRAELRAARREVWITADGPERPAGEAPPPVDGVLRPSPNARAGYELLDAVPAPAPKAAPKEFASIP